MDSPPRHLDDDELLSLEAYTRMLKSCITSITSKLNEKDAQLREKDIQLREKNAMIRELILLLTKEQPEDSMFLDVFLNVTDVE